MRDVDLNNLRISVIGIGFVGLVSSVAFAKHGYKTLCIDIDATKINRLNDGISPFYEPSLDDMLLEMVKKGILSGKTKNVNSLRESNATFICVGTPQLPDGKADISAVRAVVEDIGDALREKSDYHLVVVKSTVPPGTTEKIVIPIIEKKSGKKAGRDFGVCMNPEFLREGTAIWDSLHPDRIVIGELDKKSGEYLNYIYREFDSPKIRCDIGTAEMVKYASNVMLAARISLTNEFSRICEKLNLDVYKVMRIVGLDQRIGSSFLDAGVGFGGSCFSKDLKAIMVLAKSLDVETPIIESVLMTNDIQIEHFISIVNETVGSLKGKTIAFLGLSFKSNTDDIRETRALPIIERLVEQGAHIKAYDPKAIVNFKLMTNLPLEYVDSWESALKGSDCVIVQTSWDEFKNIGINDFKRLLKRPIIIDGRRTYDPMNLIKNGIKYRGVGWKNVSENPWDEEC